jgi:hypothetical protein
VEVNSAYILSMSIRMDNTFDSDRIKMHRIDKFLKDSSKDSHRTKEKGNISVLMKLKTLEVLLNEFKKGQFRISKLCS